MQIIDNRALLLKVRNPDRITTVIPKSKVLSDDGEVAEVLVNWDLEESIVLKNLKFKDVPSPINASYNWPGLYKPFAHQKVTIKAHHQACTGDLPTVYHGVGMA